MRRNIRMEYDINDYDDYEQNITIDEIIKNLICLEYDYIPYYTFSGDENDFRLFKFHVCLNKAIKMLNEIKLRGDE